MASETVRVEALVIGAGPGGYVAGIRLGQLKKKAMVVERDKPGGICLNVGCIPSKALINAAKYYDKLRHGADIGILADNLRVDMGKMQSWKGEVVGKLTGGVRTLLKANGCDYRTGIAKLTSRNTVEVTDKDGQVTTVQADNIIIATGSRPIEIPGFAFDGKRIVDSTGALDFTTVPERFVVIGGGVHRHRDRDPLCQAGGPVSRSWRRCRPSAGQRSRDGPARCPQAQEAGCRGHHRRRRSGVSIHGHIATGGQGNVESNAQLCVRRRSGNCSFCNSDLGLFPIH